MRPQVFLSFSLLPRLLACAADDGGPALSGWPAQERIRDLLAVRLWYSAGLLKLMGRAGPQTVHGAVEMLTIIEPLPWRLRHGNSLGQRPSHAQPLYRRKQVSSSFLQPVPGPETQKQSTQLHRCSLVQVMVHARDYQHDIAGFLSVLIPKRSACLVPLQAS